MLPLKVLEKGGVMKMASDWFNAGEDIDIAAFWQVDLRLFCEVFCKLG